MRKHLLLSILSTSWLSLWGQTTTPLSLLEALGLAEHNNLTLAIAREEVAATTATKGELNSAWYPTLMLSGEYTHTLTEIATVTSVGEIGGELLGGLAPIVEQNPTLAALLGEIGASTIRLPLVPRNTASVGAEVAWVVFSGGKRVAASRIAKALGTLSAERYAATEQAVGAMVVEAYLGAELAQRAVEVRRGGLAVQREHLREARRLEQEGVINSAERLVAEVGVKEAEALLREAESNLEVAREALGVLIGADSTVVVPTTPLFMPTAIPSKEALLSTVERAPTLSALGTQQQIAAHALSIERSRYLPSVALIGGQQLWSKGLNKNLFPRTAVGVGLSWTLFDGLSRESAISRSKASLRTAQVAQEKTRNDLHLAIDKSLATLTTAISQHKASESTQRLAEELLRIRRRAFAEGMATSSEVVDAAQKVAEAELLSLATLYTIDTSLSTLLMLSGTMEQLVTYIPPTD